MQLAIYSKLISAEKVEHKHFQNAKNYLIEMLAQKFITGLPIVAANMTSLHVVLILQARAQAYFCKSNPTPGL